MTDRSPRTTRRDQVAATRRELLEAGARVLDEQPVGTVLNQLKPNEVARQAGRTIGAFYHHWDSQERYQHDLLEHVVASDRLPTMAPAAPATLEAELDSGVSLEEAIRRHATENFEEVRSSQYLRLQMALWAKHDSDPEIAAQVREIYKQSDRALIPLCRTMLEEHGLEPRPPFTFESIAVILTALLEGLAMRHVVEPDAVPSELPSAQAAAAEQLDGQLDTGPWNLFATTVLALLPSLTTPALERDSPLWLDHEDVRGLVRRLRETWETFTGGRRPTSERPEHA